MQIYSMRVACQVLCATALCCGSAPCFAQFHSASYGYRVKLPDGWVQIPDDVIQDYLTAVLGDNPRLQIVYDAGFQPGTNEQWFDYPYVLVQPMLYSTFGVYRQLNEDEFPQVIREMTGLDPRAIVDSTVSSQARELFDNMKFGQPVLDSVNRRFIWEISMDVAEVGPIRGMVAGYFGRDSIVQIAFYSRQSEWEQYASVRRAVIDSFSFDPNKAYSVAIAAATPSTPSFWDRVLQKSVVGALSGGLVALILAALAITQRRKGSSQRESGDQGSL